MKIDLLEEIICSQRSGPTILSKAIFSYLVNKTVHDIDAAPIETCLASLERDESIPKPNEFTISG